MPQWVWKILLKDILFHLLYKLAESICIYYSTLLVRPDIFLGLGTLKKVQNMNCKHRVQKNLVIVIQKENRQPNLFSLELLSTLSMMVGIKQLVLHDPSHPISTQCFREFLSGSSISKSDSIEIKNLGMPEFS